jgi:UDP-N-acetylmuramoyl-L-alanyl-D-glutamate--2,6-diaminopimelate ligase
MRLSTLLAEFPALRAQVRDRDPEITAIVSDSRRMVPGALFVATRGENVDAHRFIPEVIEKGVAAIIAERQIRETEGNEGKEFSFVPREAFPSFPFIFAADSREALGWLAAAWHGFPSRQLALIGVTGTDGKTTTASLIHSILRAAGLRAGLISTVSAEIGDETLDTGFHVTTPEALEVQGYLARMVAAGLTHAVLETTSYGLAQHRVTGCEYDIAVVTNVTHEHLDWHKTYENYRAAKARLFSGLSTSFRKPGTPKAGVLNVDDSSYDYLRQALKEPAIGYSLRTRTPNGIVARDVAHAPDGIHFRAVGPSFDVPVITHLVGAYNVSNCLAAIAATVGALGLAPEAAQRGLAALQGVPGRMERIDLGPAQRFTAIVDFAHTPNALRRVLETAREMLTTKSAKKGDEKSSPKGGRWVASFAVQNRPRIIAVFGSAGLRDVEKRRMMAETSAELADITILTAEDPRTEPLDGILEMMAYGARTKGGVEGQTFFRVPDRGEALRLAVRLAAPGDVVLACGKGHEQSMCFGSVEYPWDDRVALRAALAELLGLPGPEMPRLPTSPR